MFFSILCFVNNKMTRLLDRLQKIGFKDIQENP